MPKIIQGYNDVKLVIAGKGGMLDDLKAQAEAMGIANKIYFTGYLNAKQVQKIYKCADVAVFPSTYEPFGIVALEGMLAGVPTVVSDIGGLDEIVDHGINGMKSYAGNPNSIADSVLTVLYDKQLAAAMAKKQNKKLKKNLIGIKLHKIHIIYMKKLFVKQLQKNKNKKLHKKMPKKLKKLTILKQRLQIYLVFRKNMLMHRKLGRSKVSYASIWYS